MNTKYVTDDKKIVKAIETVDSIVAWYSRDAFDTSGWKTMDEQLYALTQMIEHLQGLKDIFEGKPNLFYDELDYMQK